MIMADSLVLRDYTHEYNMYRNLEKISVGYFRVKFVRGEIFSSLGVSSE